MHVLISDTSVIVDLERGGILESIFGLSCEFIISDLLFESELEPDAGVRLVELGLQVANLDGAGVAKAIERRRDAPSLSLPEVFALTLASENRWVVLAGEGLLRTLAEAENLECQNILWVFDGIEADVLLEGEALHKSLSQIVAHERCGLSEREWRKRLKRYEKSSG